MTITRQPVDASVQAGSNVALTCAAEGAVQYQWCYVFRSGATAAISRDATGRELTFRTALEEYRDYPYTYRVKFMCRVSDSTETLDSAAVAVTATN